MEVENRSDPRTDPGHLRHFVRPGSGQRLRGRAENDPRQEFRGECRFFRGCFRDRSETQDTQSGEDEDGLREAGSHVNGLTGDLTHL